MIRAEAVDPNGRRVPDWQAETRCVINGAAQLEGFGSGSPTSEDDYSSGRCHFFEGRALLVLRKMQVDVPLTVRVEETREGGIISEICQI